MGKSSSGGIVRRVYTETVVLCSVNRAVSSGVLAVLDVMLVVCDAVLL